ncbi:MAG TPA: xanthine dehydrogenase family protein molybdopterin-binding subunit [Chloroflexota bacterium]|nr:xanthine dehydrogenase family protein molybdopterin-binding subunit [Chloroflexota bacterium]
MTRIVKSKTEIEGRIYERYSIWSGSDLAPWEANSDLSIVGRDLPRVDAESKVTGRAAYTADHRRPGMLFAKVLRSPYAHARINRLDLSRAAGMPGVRAVLCHRSTPKLTLSTGQPLFDRTLRYYGQAVAAVAADTEEIAEDALREIEVDYQPLPFVIDPAKAKEPGAPLVQPRGNLLTEGYPQRYERGNLESGQREAEVTVQLEFRTQMAIHQCFEPHCALAEWDGEGLTLWTSTQYIHGVARDLAQRLRIPQNRVRVLSEAIGGAFGSKQIAGEEVYLAALLARQADRPILVYFDRDEETVATGHREATVQQIRLGARWDGRLTFIEHEATAGIGSYGNHAMIVCGPSQTLYRCPNVRTVENAVYTNVAPARAFRAPGYTEGSFALESAMDELAKKLGIDPLSLRRRNEVDFDQVDRQSYSLNPIDDIFSLGAAMADWNTPKPEASDSGRRRGRGMAAQIWGGGGGPPAYAWVKVDATGTADVVVGSQDIGTGTRTALAQIAAEELGLRLEDVRIAEGDTLSGPYAPNSAGSMTVASVGPAVRAAASQACQTLLEVAAHVLRCPGDQVKIREGIVHHGLAGEHETPLADVLQEVSPFAIVGQGDRGPNPQDVTIRTFGVQFAEVEVDLATGAVEVIKQSAVHDCGRVISPLQADSQIAGGITQGVGYALTEALVVDPQTGVVLNANLESYLIPTIADVPVVDGRPFGEIDQIDNSLGVKGLGEPPIIPVAPAVANAIADAIGVRITDLPLTAAKVLAALNQEGSHAGV